MCEVVLEILCFFILVYSLYFTLSNLITAQFSVMAQITSWTAAFQGSTLPCGVHHGHHNPSHTPLREILFYLSLPVLSRPHSWALQVCPAAVHFSLLPHLSGLSGAEADLLSCYNLPGDHTHTHTLPQYFHLIAFLVGRIFQT